MTIKSPWNPKWRQPWQVVQKALAWPSCNGSERIFQVPQKKGDETSKRNGGTPKSSIIIGFSIIQWPFQDPKMEVPTIYKAYVRPIP